LQAGEGESSPPFCIRDPGVRRCGRGCASHLSRRESSIFSDLPVRRPRCVRTWLVGLKRFLLQPQFLYAGWSGFQHRVLVIGATHLVSVPGNRTVGALQPREATLSGRFCRQARQRGKSSKGGLRRRSSGLHGWPSPIGGLHLSGRSRARQRHRWHRHAHRVPARNARFVGNDPHSCAIGESCGGLPHGQPRSGRAVDARHHGGGPAAEFFALGGEAHPARPRSFWT
jgi:hypothetical protein